MIIGRQDKTNKNSNKITIPNAPNSVGRTHLTGEIQNAGDKFVIFPNKNKDGKLYRLIVDTTLYEGEIEITFDSRIELGSENNPYIMRGSELIRLVKKEESNDFSEEFQRDLVPLFKKRTKERKKLSNNNVSFLPRLTPLLISIPVLFFDDVPTIIKVGVGILAVLFALIPLIINRNKDRENQLAKINAKYRKLIRCPNYRCEVKLGNYRDGLTLGTWQEGERICPECSVNFYQD